MNETNFLGYASWLEVKSLIRKWLDRIIVVVGEEYKGDDKVEVTETFSSSFYFEWLLCCFLLFGYW
jgi:hypothetical protein